MNKILIIDDDRELCALIKRSVQAENIEADFCNTGKEGLQKLREQEYQLVVLDVMMPGMQGDVLCQRIKENKDTSWLPVILLTAKAGRNFMIEGLGLGADDYISKPFDAAILASKIDSMLKNRRRMSRYYMQRSLAMARQEFTNPAFIDTSNTLCPWRKNRRR